MFEYVPQLSAGKAKVVNSHWNDRQNALPLLEFDDWLVVNWSKLTLASPVLGKAVGWVIESNKKDFPLDAVRIVLHTILPVLEIINNSSISENMFGNLPPVLEDDARNLFVWWKEIVNNQKEKQNTLWLSETCAELNKINPSLSRVVNFFSKKAGKNYGMMATRLALWDAIFILLLLNISFGKAVN